MPSTVLDILKSAALRLGARQLGEELTGNEAQEMLTAWSQLIESENTRRNTLFTERQDTYTLTPGQQAYTLGTDPNGTAPNNVGSLSAVRPNRVTAANLALISSPEYDIPLEVMEDAAAWSDISYKTLVALPRVLYRDSGYPFDTWYIYPVPDQAYKINVWSWQQLTEDLALTDYVSFPQGYERFWITKLAIECGPIFGIEPSPSLKETAWEAERNVRSANSRSPRMRQDPALMSRNKRSGPDSLSALRNYMTGGGLL